MATIPTPPHYTAQNTRVNAADDMLEVLEEDLKAKALTAFQTHKVEAHVHGVFSLDELEAIRRSELQNQIGVGVGYAQARPVTNSNSGLTIATVAFLFVVILAVPVDNDQARRHNATKLLTVLRRSIAGQSVGADGTNRKWSFVSEGPRIEESTEETLYYAQVWQIVMQNVGN